MREFSRNRVSLSLAVLPTLCAALGVSGAAQAQSTTITTVTTTTTGPTIGPDPANANLAPIETSPAPPPSLPVYEQPPVPGPGYIWTPGYWALNAWGFYWVPGAWLLAPYTGALWTPGYWGYVDGLYRWHAGYWGPHIGFYGGVNYGFGYLGTGYVGGYWDRDVFLYNRAVTHVDVTRVTNVYVRNVDVYVDHRRISYNGGRGGMDARPNPHELAAAREQHLPPTRMQIEHMRDFGHDRAQFAGHGRGPAMMAMPRPLLVGSDPRGGPGGLNMRRDGPAQDERRSPAIHVPGGVPNGPGNGVDRWGPGQGERVNSPQRMQPGMPSAPASNAGRASPARPTANPGPQSFPAQREAGQPHPNRDAREQQMRQMQEARPPSQPRPQPQQPQPRPQSMVEHERAAPARGPERSPERAAPHEQRRGGGDDRRNGDR